MLHEHGGQQDDEDVDGVVQDEYGGQELPCTVLRIWGIEQPKDHLGSLVIGILKRLPLLRVERKEGNLTAGDEGTRHEEQHRGQRREPEKESGEFRHGSEGQIPAIHGVGAACGRRFRVPCGIRRAISGMPSSFGGKQLETVGHDFGGPVLNTLRILPGAAP